MTDIEICPTPYEASTARSLVGAALADLAARYGGEGDETPVASIEFELPNGLFVIAWRDGTPVGCAGWRSHGDSGELAELKRMYVDPAARGAGVATALLDAIEESARSEGRTRLILECGERQPEAIALYESRGYARIKDFGFYKDEAGVRSYAKELLPS